MAHLRHLGGAEQRRYVSALFTRISGRYDLMNDIMSLGLIRLWRADAAKTALRGLEGPVLDVAAGTGALTGLLARRGAHVVGLDLTAPMLRRALARGNSSPTPPQFIVGDAFSLPFPDETFATVTCAFGLRNMPEAFTPLREMVRVLRPGGKAVTIEIMPPVEEMALAGGIMWMYLRKAVPFLGGLLARETRAYRYLSDSVASFYTAEDLAALMRDAGFTDVSFRRKSLGAVAIHVGTRPA